MVTRTPGRPLPLPGNSSRTRTPASYTARPQTFHSIGPLRPSSDSSSVFLARRPMVGILVGVGELVLVEAGQPHRASGAALSAVDEACAGSSPNNRPPSRAARRPQRTRLHPRSGGADSAGSSAAEQIVHRARIGLRQQSGAAGAAAAEAGNPQRTEQQQNARRQHHRGTAIIACFNRHPGSCDAHPLLLRRSARPRGPPSP